MTTTRTDGYAALLDDLQGRGLLDGEWRKVFDAVPRAAFIPERIWRQEPDRCVPVTSPAERLNLIHSDEPVVIQVDDGRDDGPGVATSSNSMPSMVAKMLGLLDVEDGHCVLEIGTASGYVAALLSERVGEDRVYSVEIDPVLAEQAAAALHTAGYMPQLKVGDGEAGWPDARPFDRLIATCALRHIPLPYVQQVRSGGIIVAPLARTFWSGALVQLTVGEDGIASGPFRDGASYMPMRSHRLATEAAIDESTARSRASGLDPAKILTLGFALYAGTRLPDVSLWHAEQAGHLQVWASRPNGAAATAATGEEVWQYGDGNLWEEIEETYREYEALASPAVDEFGLTVTARGGQEIWLREPHRLVLPR